MNPIAIQSGNGVYTTCANPCNTSAYVIYPSSSTGSASSGYQPISVTIQPDTEWVNHNILPIGFFGIEIAIAIGILAAAKCALSYFVPSTQKGKK
jgi:hypothetical protein